MPLKSQAQRRKFAQLPRDTAEEATPPGWADHATTLPAARTAGKQYREIAASLRERGAR